MRELKINPEFRDILRELTSSELEGLESSVLRDGCLSPIIIWGDTIIDGHNRYAICKKHNLEFQTVSLEFASDYEAGDWIETTQGARRNVSQLDRDLARGRLYNLSKKPQGGTGANQHKQQSGQNVHSAKTDESIAEKFGVSPRTIRRAGKFAEAVDEVKAMPEAREMTKDEILQAAKQKVHVSNNSGNNEWYTPKEFIDAARATMGAIDLDPASSSIANETVRASAYFDADDDGLKQEWRGNVWMNPPYAQPLISQFCTKLEAEFVAGNVKQACVLVNNGTETAWFQALLSCANAVCFPRNRIKFLDPEGKPGAPLQGQAILYIGKNQKTFAAEFSKFGFCLKK